MGPPQNFFGWGTKFLNSLFWEIFWGTFFPFLVFFFKERVKPPFLGICGLFPKTQGVFSTEGRGGGIPSLSSLTREKVLRKSFFFLHPPFSNKGGATSFLFGGEKKGRFFPAPYMGNPPTPLKRRPFISL